MQPGFFYKKKPAMEIAGMCLPLKPQKEKITLPLSSDTNSFHAPTWYGCFLWGDRIQHLKKIAVSEIK